MNVRHKWRNRWFVVLAAAAGMMMVAVPPYSFGAFVAPLQAEFGWTRAEIAIGMSISGIAVAIAGPFVGYVADRFGARKIALVGTVIECLGIAGLSRAGPTIASFWACYAFLALGACICSPLVWTRAVVSRFVENRGFALSLAVGGATVAGMIAPLLATFLIGHWGWRNAYLGLAAFLFILTFPLLFAFFYEARDLGERDEARVDSAPPAPPLLRGHLAATVRGILSTRRFWLIATSAFAAGGAALSVNVHLISLLQDRGLAPMHAAIGMSLVSVVSIAGRLGGGILLDRISVMPVVVIMFAPPITACLILMAAPANATLLLGSSALLGLALGVELELLAYITSRCFDLSSYGTAYGMIAGAFTIGGATVPPLLGQLRAVEGNYDGALMIMAVGFFLSASAIRFLKIPRPAKRLGVLGAVPS